MSTSSSRYEPPRKSRPSATCFCGTKLRQIASCAGVNRFGSAAARRARQTTQPSDPALECGVASILSKAGESRDAQGGKGLHCHRIVKSEFLSGHKQYFARRAWEHREGVADGFTRKYRFKQLVAERHDRYPLPSSKNLKTLAADLESRSR